MVKINKVVAALIVTILLVSSVIGTIIYYNSIMNDENSKNASLQHQISDKNNDTSTLAYQILNLKNQLTNLTRIVTKLTSANLVTSLAIKEYPATIQYNISYENALFIVGSVTNTGEGVAYNAGLHIVAYTVDNALKIDDCSFIRRWSRL
jgi:cell division protein FtsL